MGANFTPTFGAYSPLTPFRYWCQKVLPLVYDDSLSYYECLNKTVDYLNKTMEDVETLHGDTEAMLAAFNQLQTYVNTYFDELDLTSEVQTVLDRMAENGSLDALLRPLVGERIGDVVAEQIEDVVASQIYDTVAEQINNAIITILNGSTIVQDSVEDWLDEHIQVGQNVVDNTLSISGAAADALTVGNIIGRHFSIEENYNNGDYVLYSGMLYQFTADHTAGAWTGTDAITVKIEEEISKLKASLMGGLYRPSGWRDGMIYNHLESTNSTFQRTSEIALKKGETISFTGGKGITTLPVNALTRVVEGEYQALRYYSAETAEVITYTATLNMVVIVSTLKSLYGNDLIVEKNGIIEQIESNIDELQLQYESLPEYIKNNVVPIEIVRESSGATPYTFTKGETYVIKNKGTSTISLSTRTSPGATTIDAIIVAGGITKQFKASENASYIVCSTAADFEISTIKTLVPFIESTLYKFGNYGTSLPLVRFDFNRTMGNYTDELSDVDFMANNGRWYSIMQTIYDKFDSLVSAYGDYISKIDAATDVGLTYPAYANLNGEAIGNYSPTPTYKTYMYKLVDNNPFVYSSRNPKKKLFLIGATHGNETAGSFNLYLLAKNLCDATNSDYFKLRESFDVYIIPCLNGYGMCHYIRWNANGVDINRNYPITNWAESGEPFVIGYTGPSPASEFETQLIVALQNKYAFDVAIDHHNYGASSSQFYTEFWYDRFNSFANAALADCSSMFIESLPAYFGTRYRLFVDITNSTRPNVVLSDTMPCMAKWMYEQGIDFAATIEIGNQINYINGELNTATDIPKYTNDVFKVGEFTLRNQLLYYCGFVLGSVV